MKQSKMLISEGRILYNVVKEAIENAGYSLQTKNQKAVLVWYDNLRESDFYSTLKPWQIVNRIPFVNLICRKAPFIQLMNRMKVFFPSLYTFYPESMILPVCNTRFQKLLSNNDKKYIVKPDNGSLGYGITILSKNSIFKPFKNLSVAQEYIESYLINDTKFDLRVYALISSVSPLRIYVYHDGVARFCSEKNNVNSIYSQLTNTAVNRNNPNAKIESITKTIIEVFQLLEQKGVNTNLIWSKIENAVILTILPALSYMKFGVSQKDLLKGYNRCFQVLGFDFILDTDLNPYVLEVNYRPSLDADTEAERQLKIKMLGTAMHIGAPLETLQKIINENNEIANFSKEKWDVFYKKFNEKSSLIDQNVNTGLFNLVFPSKSVENTEIYNQVLNIANRCPTKLTPHYKLPVPLKKPDPSLLPKVKDIIFYSNNFEIDDSFKQIKNDTKEQSPHKNTAKNETENNLIQNDQQKNNTKLKLKNNEKNNSNIILNKHLQSSNSSNKEESDNKIFIRKIIQEIESMKELDTKDPKEEIQKSKPPENPKSPLQRKAVISNKPQVLPTALKNQNNASKNQNTTTNNIKQNEPVVKVNPTEGEKPPAKLKIEIHSPKQTLNQKQEENPNIKINENKEKDKEVVTNVSKNKEINLANTNPNSTRIVRTRRSASTKPVQTKRTIRPISSIEQANGIKGNHNYQNIEDFSRKYFEIITSQLKQEIGNSPNLNTNTSQTKSSKTIKHNYSKTTTRTAPTEKPLIFETELNKPQLSNTTINKSKSYAPKSSITNENTKNSEATKTINHSTNQPVTEKQVQQKPSLNSNSINTNLNQHQKENPNTNNKANIEKEYSHVNQNDETKLKLKPKLVKNDQNLKQIEKVDQNALKNEKVESKQIQEDSTTTATTTETKLKIKPKADRKPSTDQKPRPKAKLQETKFDTGKEVNNPIKADPEPKNKVIKSGPKLKLEIDNNTPKPELEAKNKIVKTEPKSKFETNKNTKINSEIKKKIILKSEQRSILDKDTKSLKNESKSIQEVELTAKPETNGETELIKTFAASMKNIEKQKH